MRFLVYLITLLFVGTAVAQNPTILQGNYITNVFGQSNFVLNPNAQTNVLNVTKSASAVISRNATTPLVATSDFSIYSTANGQTWDWSTRAFDKGMKNQNCEARFTYKNMQSTTTAQLLQNNLVIAQLTLSASTDPRIASINFPCGDLTYSTTFRITDSGTIPIGTPASIGGIYVGLATNQANVAQAELVGTWKMSGATNCLFSTSSTSYGSPSNYSTADTDCSDPSVTGDVTTKGKVLGFDLKVKPGKYIIQAQAPVLKSGTSAGGALFRIGDGSAFSGDQTVYSSTAGMSLLALNTVTFQVEYTTSGTKTVYLDGKVDSGSTNAVVENNAGREVQFLIYRFPSSSELVVTPERQNVYGAKRFTGSAVGINVCSGSAVPCGPTVFNSASITQTNIGKCQNTTTANDIGCKIANMPVGSYQITYSGFMRVYTAAAAADTNCVFDIYETTTSGVVLSHSAVAAGQAAQNVMDGKNITGVFSNTSVGDRNFVIRAKKQGGATTGYCQTYYDASDTGQMIITPLDQPSNSALYVQGPVKSAGTGDAIASGYVGEFTRNSGLGGVGVTNNTWVNANSLTLTPGVWIVSASYQLDSIVGLTAISTAQTVLSQYSGTTTTDHVGGYNVQNWQFQGTTISTVGSKELSGLVFNVTSTLPTIYAKCYFTATFTSMTCGANIRAVRLN